MNATVPRIARFKSGRSDSRSRMPWNNFLGLLAGMLQASGRSFGDQWQRKIFRKSP